MLTADSPSIKQHQTAIANQRKREKGAIRRGLISGEITLAELMADPPVVLRNATLADILRMRRAHTSRPSPSMIALGQWAIRDKINLLTPLAMSSPHARAWVAEHGDYMCHNQQEAA